MADQFVPPGAEQLAPMEPAVMEPGIIIGISAVTFNGAVPVEVTRMVQYTAVPT